jgi:hypothetical protein
VALAAEGCRLIFMSSDAVFGGRELPYDEDEPPCPLTPYGAAKAAAETAVRALRPDALVARCSLIVASDGSSGEERRVHALAAGHRCPGRVAPGSPVRPRRALEHPAGQHPHRRNPANQAPPTDRVSPALPLAVREQLIGELLQELGHAPHPGRVLESGRQGRLDGGGSDLGQAR